MCRFVVRECPILSFLSCRHVVFAYIFERVDVGLSVSDFPLKNKTRQFREGKIKDLLM